MAVLRLPQVWPEIRRLADQTAVATLEIEQMVRQMQSAVSSGVMEMDKFNEDVRGGVRRAWQLPQLRFGQKDSP